MTLLLCCYRTRRNCDNVRHHLTPVEVWTTDIYEPCRPGASRSSVGVRQGKEKGKQIGKQLKEEEEGLEKVREQQKTHYNNYGRQPTLTK